MGLLRGMYWNGVKMIKVFIYMVFKNNVRVNKIDNIKG